MAALACLAPAVTAVAQSTGFGEYRLMAQRSIKILAGATVSNGAVGSNGTVIIRGATVSGPVVADRLTMNADATDQGSAFFNDWNGKGTIVGIPHNSATVPFFTMPMVTVSPGTTDVVVPAGATQTIASGVYRSITIHSGAHVTLDQQIELDSFVMHKGAEVDCISVDGCYVSTKSRTVLRGNVGASGPMAFVQEGPKTMVIGGPGLSFRGGAFGPTAKVKLLSATADPLTFTGDITADRILIGKGAIVDGTLFIQPCGDTIIQSPEQCDPPNDSACPGECLPNCKCPFVPPLIGTPSGRAC
jgi:cytoskeletal protein CcmA (bactofilin family)